VNAQSHCATALQHPDSPCSFPESYLSSRICSTAFPLPCSALHHYTKLPAFPPPSLHNSSALQHYQKPLFPALFPATLRQEHHSLHCSVNQPCGAAAQEPPWSPTSLLKGSVFVQQHCRNLLVLPPPSSPLGHSPALQHQTSLFSSLLCSFHSIPGCNTAEASPSFF